MKICIPVESDRGQDSRVFSHFGSAPLFMLVDSDTGLMEPLGNANRGHGHGMCNPLSALGGHAVDAVVVGGIGRRALEKLNAAGVIVYLARHPALSETLRAHSDGVLEEVTPSAACGGHDAGHSGGCH